MRSFLDRRLGGLGFQPNEVHSKSSEGGGTYYSVRPGKDARATQPTQYRTAAISPRRMSPGLVRNESPRLVSSQIKELSSKVDNLRFSTNEKLDEIANYVSDELASMRNKASSNLEQALITNNHLMTLDMLKQEPNKSKLALRIVWRALKPDKEELF